MKCCPPCHIPGLAAFLPAVIRPSSSHHLQLHRHPLQSSRQTFIASSLQSHLLLMQKSHAPKTLNFSTSGLKALQHCRSKGAGASHPSSRPHKGEAVSNLAFSSRHRAGALSHDVAMSLEQHHLSSIPLMASLLVDGEYAVQRPAWPQTLSHRQV